jgi:hypothetical protein
MKLGHLQPVQPTNAEFEALWAATDEPDTARRVTLSAARARSRLTTRPSWRSAIINHLDTAGPSQLECAEGCSENGFDLGQVEVEPLLVGRHDQRTALGFFAHYCRQIQSKMLGNLPNLFWCEHHALHSSEPLHRGVLRVLDLEPMLSRVRPAGQGGPGLLTGHRLGNILQPQVGD